MHRIFLPLLVLVTLSSTAFADESIVLIDKTKIVGKLAHFYDGVLSVELPGGTTMKLPAAKVLRVEFKLPKPRATFATPEKAFAQMKQAALKGDLEGYVESHSAYYQMFLNHQIAVAGPQKFAKQLKQEWGSVKLKVLKTATKGDTAVITVQREGEDQKQEGELRLVKENGEWKMILPL